MKPGGLAWELAGDWRVMMFLGTALTLQVAHPTIGAGVTDHSVYAQDPWGRLVRSFFPVVRLVYAENPAEHGRWIRDRHTTIKGTRPDGEKYHALHPEAYWFVLATGFDAIVQTYRRYGTPLTNQQEADLYEEFRGAWPLVGLREDQIPATVEEFWDTYDRVLNERLQPSDEVNRVLEVIHHPSAPDILGGVPDPVWKLASAIPMHTLHKLTLWSIRPELRERLGVRWTRRDELQARAIATTIKIAYRAVPRPLRWVPPAFEGHRRERTLLRAPAQTRPTA